MSDRGRRRGHAVERARADLAAGRAWLAAQRLEDRLRNVGHDDEAMQLMGAVRASMGDECEAGRWWLLSGATGDAVEVAVGRYVAAHGGDVVAAIEALPEAGRHCAVGELPPAALGRIERLGHPLPADRTQSLLRRTARSWKLSEYLAQGGCLVLLILGIVAGIAGLVAWAALGVRWLLGG